MTDAEAIIEELDSEEAAAFLRGDAERLRHLWSPDLVVNAPHNRLMADREAMLAAVASGRLRHAELHRTVEAVRLHGDIAISMGSETVRDEQGPLAGDPHRRRYTNIWRRDGDGWRIIARHAHVYR